MKLTEEAREAIRKEVSNFLRGWGTVLGVTNLIALGGILWFVFTQLPVTAAELAEAQILSQVSLVTEPVINRALEAFEDVNNRQARVEILGDQLEKNSDRVQSQANNLNQDLEALGSSISEAQNKAEALESALNALAESEEAEIGTIIDQLSQSPDVDTIISDLSRINDQLGRINKQLDKQNFLANGPEGFAFLSNESCPTGFLSIEDGYIKLGGENLSLVATGSNVRDLSHYHPAGNLVAAIGFGGNTPTMINDRTDTTFRGDRIVTWEGKVDNTNDEAFASAVAGNTADTTLSFNVEPRHIVMRLCIKQ